MKLLRQTALVIVTSLILWYLLALVLATPALPPPLPVIVNLGHELLHGLCRDVAYSMTRVLASTAAALLLGVPLGILIGYGQRWDRLLSPFLYLSYPVPKLALLPVIMLLLGLGEASKMLMIFLIIFFPVTIDVIAAVKSMDRELLDVLRIFGIRGKTLCLRVILPGLAAPILNSVKITTGIALSVLFFAENYGTRYGLGYYIINSWQKMAYIDMYTGILALALLGFLLFMALDLAEKQVTKWK